MASRLPVTQFVFVDVIRIMAILGVITIHSANYILYSGLYSHGLTWWFANVLRSTSRVSVPLFIMLSGFLLLNAAKNSAFPVIAKKTMYRLAIPLVFWYLAGVLWQYFFWHSPILMHDVITEFLKTNTTHLYYLQALIGLYLCVPVILKIDQQLQPFYKWLSVVGLFAYSCLVTAVAVKWSQLQIINFVTIFSLYLGYFYLGKLLFSLKITSKTTWLSLIIFGITAGLNASGFQNFFFNNFQRLDHYSAPGVTMMSVALFIFLRGMEPHFAKLIKKSSAKILAHLAASTYGIYLMHYIVKDIVERYILVIGTVRSGLTLYVLANILLIFVISLALTELIKKISVTKPLLGE